MSFLRENIINNTLNYIVLYKIIMRMITNIEDTKAFKLGIVDKNGKILRKMRTLKTREEKEALTRLDVFVFNLKRILGPLARSKLVNITAALFLLKEQDNLNNLEDFENRYTLLETGYSEFESGLDSEDLEMIRKMSETLEEDIANVVGTGEHIAGITGDPPVRKKKKKVKKKDIPDDTKNIKKSEKMYEGATNIAISKKQIRGVIGLAKSKLVLKNISVKNIADEIEKVLRRKYDIEVSTKKSSNVTQGSIVINAYYDPDNDQKEDTPIEIELAVSDPEVVLNLDNSMWNKFADQLSDAIQHEYLHMVQYRNRDFAKPSNFKPSKNSTEIPGFYRTQQYLGNSDEIEAYALNISNELLNTYKTRKVAVAKLKRLDKSIFKSSPNLMAYFMAFHFDSRHPVIRKLLKKILIYIEKR